MGDSSQPLPFLEMKKVVMLLRIVCVNMRSRKERLGVGEKRGKEHDEIVANLIEKETVPNLHFTLNLAITRRLRHKL